MNLIDIIDYLEEENARLIARALESLDQVDEQQQWLDEINVLLGDHTNTQEERLARLRGVLEENEKLREIVSLYSGPAYAALLEENERLREGKALWSKQANDLEARIDAALAVKMPQPNYEDEEVYEAYVAGWDDCMGVTIEALKGEK